MAKKRIHNPKTRKYYKIREKKSKYGRKGQIMGLWSSKKSKQNNRSTCILATTVLLAAGKSEDCYELQMFRLFRDKYVRQLNNGDELITLYYEVAPKVISFLTSDSVSDTKIQNLYDKLQKIVMYIEKEDYKMALDRCIQVFCSLLEEYNLENEKTKFLTVVRGISNATNTSQTTGAN